MGPVKFRSVAEVSVNPYGRVDGLISDDRIVIYLLVRVT